MNMTAIADVCLTPMAITDVCLAVMSKRIEVAFASAMLYDTGMA
jgi:hypothetical protein